MFFVLVRNIDNAMQCNELCKIAGALNSTAISKYVTLKMTDVPSKHVWKIKESCYVYTNLRDQLLSSVLFIVYRSQTISLPHLLRNLTIYLLETGQFVPDRLFSNQGVSIQNFQKHYFPTDPHTINDIFKIQRFAGFFLLSQILNFSEVSNSNLFHCVGFLNQVNQIVITKTEPYHIRMQRK